MMNLLSDPAQRLKSALWLIAIHSFVVGVCLIFLPSSKLPLFGFEVHPGNFFRAQGGVFHIVLSVVYIIAAVDLNRSHNLVIVSIIAKMIATVFLLTYFFAINSIWTVLISGIVDFLMGVVLIILFRGFKQKTPGD